MDLNANELVKAFIAAAKRHDDMLASYPRAADALFHETVRASEPIQSEKRIFQGRTESEGSIMAFVLKSNLTDKAHFIGKSVLNFQTSGLGYHPSSGRLCGFIDVILSDGDYWSLFKSSKVPFLKAMAVGTVSQSSLSSMYTRASRRLQALRTSLAR